jgi:hypothetical protein
MDNTNYLDNINDYKLIIKENKNYIIPIIFIILIYFLYSYIYNYKFHIIAKVLSDTVCNPDNKTCNTDITYTIDNKIYISSLKSLMNSKTYTKNSTIPIYYTLNNPNHITTINTNNCIHLLIILNIIILSIILIYI